MKSKIYLRIAFGLIIFHLAGHTVGHLTWKDTPDPKLAEIIHNMDTYQFEFMGTAQTIGANHEGYSLMLGLTLIMLGIITWMFSDKADSFPEMKSFVMVIGLFFIVFGIVEAIYFFPLPGVTSILAGVFQIIGARVKSAKI